MTDEEKAKELFPDATIAFDLRPTRDLCFDIDHFRLKLAEFRESFFRSHAPDHSAISTKQLP